MCIKYEKICVNIDWSEIRTRLIEIQKMMITLKDMAAKQVAVLATVMYMVDGSTKTMKSVWNGAPGQIVRALK